MASNSVKKGILMIGRVEISGYKIENIERLTQKRSAELLKRIKSGDKLAKEEFVIGNLRLVLSIIKRFQNAKVSSDDMFQAGCVGLIKAVDNFNDQLGVRFSTYAVPMILGEVKRVVRNHSGLRISRSIRDMAYKALKARGELENGCKEVTLQDIAEKLSVQESEVAYALDAISDHASIYDPVYDKAGDTIELLDQLKDERSNDEKWTENVALTSAMEKLDERERKIIYLRYYEGKTQTEISGEIGLSQAQVSRIEKLALAFMKKRLSYS